MRSLPQVLVPGLLGNPAWDPNPRGKVGRLPGQSLLRGRRTRVVRPGLCCSHSPGDLLLASTTVSRPSFHPSPPPPSVYLHRAASLISAQIATILPQIVSLEGELEDSRAVQFSYVHAPAPSIPVQSWGSGVKCWSCSLSYLQGPGWLPPSNRDPSLSPSSRKACGWVGT